MFHRFDKNFHQEATQYHTRAPKLPIQPSLKSGSPATLGNLRKVWGDLSVGDLQGWRWPHVTSPNQPHIEVLQIRTGNPGKWNVDGGPETVQFFGDRMPQGNDRDDQDISFDALTFFWRFEGFASDQVWITNNHHQLESSKSTPGGEKRPRLIQLSPHKKQESVVFQPAC